MVRVGLCSSSVGLVLLLVAAYGVVLSTGYERFSPHPQNYSEQFQFECFPASDKGRSGEDIRHREWSGGKPV